MIPFFASTLLRLCGVFTHVVPAGRGGAGTVTAANDVSATASPLRRAHRQIHTTPGTGLPPAGVIDPGRLVLVDFGHASKTHDARCGSAGSGTRVTIADGVMAGDYLVKACPSARHAAQEWLAARLFSLLGLRAPASWLAHGCAAQVDGVQDPQRLYVASRWEPTYRDLGVWLIGPDAIDVLGSGVGGSGEGPAGAGVERSRRQVCHANAVMSACGGRSGTPFWLMSGEVAKRHADAVESRFHALQALAAALPRAYQIELEQHYIASRWLDNWDPLNVFMENLGVYRDEMGTQRVMSVDFGACLQLGFQGRLKRDSRELALAQRHAIAALPPLSATFDLAAASFGAATGVACGEVSIDPASLPYGEQMTPLVHRMVTAPPLCDERDLREAMRDTSHPRVVMLEMAFRLSLIERADVTLLAQWAMDAAATAGCHDADPGWLDAHGLADTLMDRRDALVASLGGRWLPLWRLVSAERESVLRQRCERASLLAGVSRGRGEDGVGAHRR